ncbi:hypothetical protein ACFQ0M_42430 [Kitasatospora aburaviensis]
MPAGRPRPRGPTTPRRGPATDPPRADPVPEPVRSPHAPGAPTPAPGPPGFLRGWLDALAVVLAGLAAMAVVAALGLWAAGADALPEGLPPCWPPRWPSRSAAP